jgi:hypothetical protein
MLEPVLPILRQCEELLLKHQALLANRDRAIALTHLQTSILWIEKMEKIGTL